MFSLRADRAGSAEPLPPLRRVARFRDRAMGRRPSRCRGSAPTRSIRRAPTCRRAAALQPRRGRLRERDARPVHDVSRRAAAIARSPTTSASASAATAFTGRGPIARAVHSACPSGRATGTGQRAIGRRLLPVVGDRLHFYVSGRQGVPGTDLPGSAAPAWRPCGATASRRSATSGRPACRARTAAIARASSLAR